MHKKTGLTRLIAMSLCLYMAGCASRFDSPSLKELDDLLANSMPPSVMTRQMKENLPRLQRLLDEQLGNPPKEKEVVFLLGVHINIDRRFDDLVRTSQAQVLFALERLRIDVIGAEAVFGEDLTEASMIENQKTMARDLGFTLVDVGSLSSGVLPYMRRHPQAQVVGLEDRQFIAFSTAMGIISYKNPGSIADRVFAVTNSARSDIALALMLKALRDRNRPSGVLVFGGAHLREFQELARRTGIRAVSYCAIAEIPMDKLTLNDLHCPTR